MSAARMNISITSKVELQNESAVLMNSPKNVARKSEILIQDGVLKTVSPSSLEANKQPNLINIVIGEGSA